MRARLKYVAKDGDEILDDNTVIMCLVHYQSVHSGWSHLAASASVGVYQLGPDQMLSACPGIESKATCISDWEVDKPSVHSQINIPF